MTPKAKLILGGAASLAILVVALDANPEQNLVTRRARDLVVKQGEVILARLTGPGAYRIEVPCEHAPEGHDALPVRIEERTPEEEPEAGEEHPPPPWDISIEWGAGAGTTIELGINATATKEEGRLACAHAAGESHEIMLVARSFPETDLVVGEHRVTAEVMATRAKRSWGLQGRAGLPDGYGMWFVYSRPIDAVFVMKTVSFPISIAFVRADGRVTNIERLNPGDDHRVRSGEKVQYVLEMEQGWFAEHGIGPGTVVRWPEAE